MVGFVVLQTRLTAIVLTLSMGCTSTPGPSASALDDRRYAALQEEMGQLRAEIAQLSTMQERLLQALGAGRPTASRRRISLGRGFSPDPYIADGENGTDAVAEDFSDDETCRGSVSTAPDLVLDVQTAFPVLNIAANAMPGQEDEDLTLVVRTPTGAYLCNDDTVGVSPLISAAVEPGEYAIWVGAYADNVVLRYRLAVSTRSIDVEALWRDD